jgi:uncharacterized surface protein with fasciclin (FAS1) repeats
MKKSMLTLLAGAALAVTSIAATAQKTDPTVGGAPMYPDKTIVQNAVNSPIHKTLVAAVKAAGLVDTLNSPGPFTVFAPTDDAFAKLPAGTVDTLVQPENKATLVKILTYHVVPGKISSKELIKMIKKGGGTYSAKTVEGGSLTFSLDDGKVKITDEKGGFAFVTIPDVFQSNGVIHVIDTVLMPS